MAITSISAVLQNPWVVALIGGAVSVILAWGYVVYQKTAIESLQVARGGQTTDDEEISLHVYETPPLIPIFGLGSVISYLIWFVLRWSGAAEVAAKTVGMSGGAMTATAIAKASDFAMPNAEMSIAGGAAATAVEVATTLLEPITSMIDTVKRTVVPSPITKSGLAPF